MAFEHAFGDRMDLTRADGDTMSTISTLMLSLAVTLALTSTRGHASQGEVPRAGSQGPRNMQLNSCDQWRTRSTRTKNATLALALDRLQQRIARTVLRDGVLHDGTLKYDADIESLRLTRTREIIEARMQPSPCSDDDPEVLELIARQAASAEMFFRREWTGEAIEPNRRGIDRLVIGTVPALTFTPGSALLATDYIVVVPSGVMSFLNQITKAIVLSWEPKRITNSGGGFGTTHDAIERVLTANPRPTTMFYETLQSMVFDGHIGATNDGPLPPEYGTLLVLIRDSALRFVVAHEYGHGFSQYVDSTIPLPPGEDMQSQELQADAAAFRIQVTIANWLDGLPPNVALQGGALTLSGLDILRRAVDTAKCGQVQKDPGYGQHPPYLERLAKLEQRYRAFVGQPSAETPVQEGSWTGGVNLNAKGALVASDTLELLWEHVRPRFIDAYRAKRRPHRVWSDHVCTTSRPT